ncbi:S8 family peptidase, partial [Mycolicibacterium sp.]|uniref:S8 family peptidase n=1 Tax=Mycolicibacterium sp. TaxID=2320850 RepID=UPI001A1D1706
MTAARVATAVAVDSGATGVLGSDLESPFGWIAMRATRGQIGRPRLVVTRTSAATAVGNAVAAPDVSATLPFAKDEVLVVWTPGMAALGRALEMAILGASVIDLIGTQEMLQTQDGLVYRLKVPGGTVAAIQILSRMPGVVLAEPNYRLSLQATSNDPYYTDGSLWGMNSADSPTAFGPDGTTNQYGCGAEAAWAAGVTGSSTVVVGVIDEGIQITHPELAPNIWVNPGEVAGDGIDNDNNGYIDDVNGWDFYYGDNTVYDGAEDDHGTHVAGTIGAVGGNGTGVAGVNWNVKIIPAKFLGPYGGYISDAVAALDYLVDLKNRYHINLVAASNSWGGGGYSAALHGAIIRAAKADILFVAAAGNSSSNNDTTGSYPSNYSSLVASATETAASYECVIAVASITSSGALSYFSSYGASTVDIGAPGSGVISTVPENSYANYSGTSMATPHVTGALALYASQHPTATAADLRTAILGNATPTTSLAGITVTGGRLNLVGLFTSNPVVSISPVSVSVAEGNSGTAAVTLTVGLSQAAVSTVTVGYATANGSATAGQDYTAASGTVTFTAGQTSQQVSVTVAGDATIEADETFTVTLSAASGATLGAAVSTVTITNDDLPVVSISPVSVSVVEGDSGTATVTVTVGLSQASLGTVTVGYATANGSASAGLDYTAASGTVTFTAGQTSQQVSVSVAGDATVEADETFTVVLSAASGATLGTATSTVTIANDDGPVVSISPVSVSVVEGDSG